MMTPDRRSCRGVTPDTIPAQFAARTEGAPALSVFDCLVAPTPHDLVVCSGRRNVQKYLLIAIGGALGSIARYWVGSTIGSRMGIKFPYGTLVVNITACVIIGFSLTYLGKRAELNPAWRFLIPVGFIGAYSTFSTYEWETLSTLRAGAFGIAALYAVGSFALGLAAVWGGSILGELVP
jgi:CrcB protein